MKLTNELKSYVTSKVAEIIPKPTSEAEANKVQEAAREVATEYREFINAQTEEFIKSKMSDPIFEGCSIAPGSLRYVSLNVNFNESPAVKQWYDDKKEYDAFRGKVESKVFALLSVQKEVSDLDTFIANVIASIK